METLGPNSTFAAAAGTPYAAEAAAETYLAGGNAADAAVAAAAAVSVTEPLMSSIGGGGFALVRDPAGGGELFDYYDAVPGQGAPGHGLRGRRQPADHHSQVRSRGAIHRRGGIVSRTRLLEGVGETSGVPQPAGHEERASPGGQVRARRVQVVQDLGPLVWGRRGGAKA